MSHQSSAAASLTPLLGERSFRAVMENVQDMVAILTAEGRFLWGSPSTERLLGYAPAELTGSSALEMIHPEDRPDAGALLQRTLEAPGAVGRLMYRVRHRDGGWRVMEATGKNLLDDPQVNGIVLTARDVTQRVTAAEQLEAARALAVAANGAKTEFLSRMSHELRTPLNAILGFAQLLDADLDREADRESVEQILMAGRHLMRLIDEVLEISRIEVGQLSLSIEPLEVDQAVAEALLLVRPLATATRIALATPPPCRLLVMADAQRVRQILLNLLTNAIKYNRPDGNVTIRVKPFGDTVRISVVDSGRGIPRQGIHDLFTPFERLGAEHSGIEGTGLGLALSRRLAGEMSGTLTARSRRARGSIFRLTLPSAPHLALQPAPRSAAFPLATQPHVRGRVLAVDDNRQGLRLLQRLLERLPNVHLRCAATAEAALQAVDRGDVDLLILDLHLPGMDGHEVLRRLRSRSGSRHLPVIVVTADATRDHVELVTRLGALRVITKPYVGAELLRTVVHGLTTSGAEGARMEHPL